MTPRDRLEEKLELVSRQLQPLGISTSRAIPCGRRGRILQGYFYPSTEFELPRRGAYPNQFFFGWNMYSDVAPRFERLEIRFLFPQDEINQVQPRVGLIFNLADQCWWSNVVHAASLTYRHTEELKHLAERCAANIFNQSYILYEEREEVQGFVYTLGVAAFRLAWKK